MARTTVALCIFAISCFTHARADSFLAHVNSQEVQQKLHTQMRTLLGQGDAADIARLDRLQSQLKPLYSAMPKSANGGLDPGAARYALHRFFSQQHGWHVHGLEVTGDEKWSDSNSTAMLEDRIPGYVLELFEQRHGDRTGLRELSVLAATLEDVVHSEAIELLTKVYAAQSLPVEQALKDSEEHLILTTYLLFHTMPNSDNYALSTVGVNHILKQAASFWSGWTGTVMWVSDLHDAMVHDESTRTNPFVGKAARSRDFNSLVRLVEGMGEHFGQYQNLECRELKNALLDLSDGSGRVRLAKFYEAAMEDGRSHFTESPDYLRHLGVLDETDARQPSVILTNYILARTNCLASSSLYSVCCIDECEALMASLESTIANPLADPQEVAELIVAIPSETVAAPRNLSAPMRRRLDDIAGRHGGSVPLHGRLFAQWMHHAFPNECPYPHVTGSLAAPLTPSEWLVATRERGLRLKASKEEMQSFADAALSVNALGTLDAVQEPLLPWTEEEELRVGTVAHPMGRAKEWLRLASSAIAVSSALVGLFRMLGLVSASSRPAKAAKHRSLQPTPGSTRGSDHLRWV